MSGPEKPKVIGEEWSDERVKGFLATTQDYLALVKAYRAMRAEDFERYVRFFVEAGRDLNTVNDDGQTILDHISEHARGTPYAQALKNAGAQPAPKTGG